ncbi:hypothetical protein AVEN_174814-1 [Araneus ventricosus]|uniref:Uncharacterized protein n=1 Tax=Araneus ventricosus TaxID=182803 RepID=A0A4Y2P1G9_ARAVE|nr:hypothetical protein AVEN_174814-1 [Araneus ventricosus]
MLAFGLQSSAYTSVTIKRKQLNPKAIPACPYRNMGITATSALQLMPNSSSPTAQPGRSQSFEDCASTIRTLQQFRPWRRLKKGEAGWATLYR